MLSKLLPILEGTPFKESRGLTFAVKIPAGGDGQVEHELNQSAAVTRVSARVYAGAENDVHLNVYHKPDQEMRKKIVKPVGKDFIDGDDDVWTWDVFDRMDREDKIVVEYDNQDANNPHNFRVNVDISREVV